MKDSINKERSMGKENFFGQMVHIMKDNLKITILKDMDYIFGMMEENMKELGKIIKWKEKVT